MLALKPALQSAGISQSLLARRVNVRKATLARLLNHQVWPNKPDQHTLKAALVIELNALNFAVDDQHFEVVDAAGTVSTTDLDQETYDMLLRKQTLSPQARQQFSLFRDPFDNDVIESDDVYSSSAIRYVREYLWSTAKHGGFMAVIGESGAGKSTLRRDLIERIVQEDAAIITVEPYVLGMEDNDKKGKTLKAAAIADAIILTIAPNERPKSSMEAKSRQLHRLLKDSRRAGYSHCLIIEEAHALSIPTLKHLKRFMELEDGFKKLLSVVLIGQSELKVKLSERSPEVREVVQRCELVELQPLDAQLEDYLRFKFRRVGADLDALFDKTACDAIRERLIFSRGDQKGRETISLMYPLMINNLVTAALNSAAALGFDKVTADIIRDA